MKYTRQQLIDRINKNDTDFFQNFYNEYWEDETPENKYEEIWYLNFGDGNDLFVAINFPDENITVYMKGYYSSYDDSRFQKVALGVPYQHTETRYRPATLDEIRDMRIDEILIKEITGIIIQDTFGKGTKSEHQSFFIKNDNIKQVVKFEGDNPFENNHLKPFLDKKVKVVGVMNDYIFTITKIEEIK